MFLDEPVKSRINRILFKHVLKKFEKINENLVLEN